MVYFVNIGIYNILWIEKVIFGICIYIYKIMYVIIVNGKKGYEFKEVFFL